MLLPLLLQKPCQLEGQKLTPCLPTTYSDAPEWVSSKVSPLGVVWNTQRVTAPLSRGQAPCFDTATGTGAGSPGSSPGQALRHGLNSTSAEPPPAALCGLQAADDTRIPAQVTADAPSPSGAVTGRQPPARHTPPKGAADERRAQQANGAYPGGPRDRERDNQKSPKRESRFSSVLQAPCWAPLRLC